MCSHYLGCLDISICVLICGFQGTLHNQSKTALKARFHKTVLNWLVCVPARDRAAWLRGVVSTLLTDFLSVIWNLKFSSNLISQITFFFFWSWRPPALPHRLQCSTIGRLGLNHRVRDGYGCFPRAHRHQQQVICFWQLDNSTIDNNPYFVP